VLDPEIGGGIIWDDILADSFLFPITNTKVAVDILDQRDVSNPDLVADGLKRSNDAAYTLAMHLLAAQLNYGAGAGQCQAASDAMIAGETLLDKYNFEGLGEYLSNRNKKVKADYNLALQLAKTLDLYNNNELCGSGEAENYPPVVNITAPADGAKVSGSAVLIEATVVDKDVVGQVEFLVNGTSFVDSDGSNGWSATWDLSGVADGPYPITATATGTDGETGSHSISVTVDNVVDQSITATLTGASGWTNPSTWWAKVTVTVNPALAGAVVSGTWSSGASGTCTTDASGVCTFTLSNISKKSAKVSFKIDNIVLAGYAFDTSTSVTIEVNRPK